jgi:hypothetical protein
MRTSDGTAGRLRRGNSGQRLEYRGPVPCLALKSSPELLLQSTDFSGHALHLPFYWPNTRICRKARGVVIGAGLVGFILLLGDAQLLRDERPS